jgi:hypothetical protein
MNRTHSDMGVLKAVCILFCVLPLALIGESFFPSQLSHAGIVLTRGVNSPTRIAIDLIESLFWASAFYGIKRKAPIVWKLGWGVLAAGFLEFVIAALSSTRKLPPYDSPLIASISVMVVGCAVLSYWAIWWKRQKSYFSGKGSRP